MNVRGTATEIVTMLGIVVVAVACGAAAAPDAASTATSSPTTTVPAPSTSDGPAVVYAVAGDPTDPDGLQVLVDPATGEVVATEPLDAERARRAQDAVLRRGRSTADLGDVGYTFEQVVYDSGTLDTDLYPDVDLCAQNVVTVRSARGSALPARAHVVSLSPDDRYLVTLSSVCPEPGTMGADGIGTDLPFEATFEVFDARRPDLPGRTLLSGVEALNVGGATFSGNGRFVALETYDGDRQYRVFDLESGTEVELAGGCSTDGTNHSRFAGPWIGASSIALVLDCADGQRLMVRDLMPDGGELLVPVPAADPTAGIRAEVDHAHFDDPATASFVVCGVAERTCWVGRGSAPMVELADVRDASFLPFGYFPGG